METKESVDNLIFTKFEEVNNLLKSYNNFKENIYRLNTEIDSLTKNVIDKQNVITELQKNLDDLSILIHHKNLRQINEKHQ